MFCQPSSSEDSTTVTGGGHGFACAGRTAGETEGACPVEWITNGTRGLGLLSGTVLGRGVVAAATIEVEGFGTIGATSGGAIEVVGLGTTAFGTAAFGELDGFGSPIEAEGLATQELVGIAP